MPVRKEDLELKAVFDYDARELGFIGMPARKEDLELKAVFDYVRLKKWDDFIWHTPNEGKRSPRQGARLRAMGLMSGVSDITIAKAKGGYHGAYIELKSMQKTGKYGAATENQKQFIKNRNRDGYFATVANGLDNCIELIEWYMSLNKHPL